MDSSYSYFFESFLEVLVILTAIASSIGRQLDKLVSLLLPILYFVRKECREHPMGLIARISLIEAISNYNIVLIAINIYYFESLVNVREIFDMLIFNPPSEPSQTAFCEINFLVYIFLETISLSLHICFSVDLFITLKYPFYGGHKRVNYYNILTVLVCLVGIPLSLMESTEICERQFHNRSIYKMPLAFMVIVGAYMLVSAMIIGYSWVKEKQFGEFHGRYIGHHRLVLIVLNIVWIFPIVSNVMILVGWQETLAFWICNIVSFFALILSGSLVSLLRFYIDSFLWSKIKGMLRNMFKNVAVEGELQEVDAWNIPLGNAIASVQNKKMIHNIIQVVLETCQSEEEQNLNMEETGYNIHAIKNILRIGTLDQLKQISKINRNIEMVCYQNKNNQQLSDYSEKTIFINEIKRKGGQKNIKQEDAGRIKVQSIGDVIFADIRKRCGLDQELETSLDLQLNNQNIKKAKESLGASGSFFFFSHDYKIVIKTISDTQVNTLLKILPSYYLHMKKHPRSLLCKLYGLFSVYIQGISKLTFVMMQNSFQLMEQNRINYKIYDLKGSTIKRQVKDTKNNIVFKDINYLKSNDVFVFLTKADKQELVADIKSDITLLANHNIMDYSLLLGVGYTLNKIETTKGWLFFKDAQDLSKRRVYSLAIIDFLQEFNFNKYMELQLKKIFKGGGDISSVDTDTYFRRFMNFVNRMIVVVKCRKKSNLIIR